MDGSAWIAPRSPFVTVEATLGHIRLLVPMLRAADRAEIDSMGVAPRHLLNRLWRSSTIRRSTFLDGEIAAMWGCAGPLLSSVGGPWLFTTSEAERAPMAFLKAARRGIEEMLDTRRTLVSSVAADYERSIRFMAMLGFTIGDPFEVSTGALFRTITLER